MVNDEFMSIAVIGMSCRLPKANNLDEFWNNIIHARECYTTFSDEELRESGVSKELYSNEKFVRTKGYIENIEYFDADFFGFTPKEASITDPQHRILLETAWEALEDAGYDANRYKGKIGIFAGQSMGDYLFMNLYPQVGKYLSPKTLQMAIGNDKDSLTSKISYKLNLTGPSITVQSSSSSSLVSIAMACQNLLCYESDMALAGGVCIGVPQKYGYMYEKGGIISKDGHCRTFDNNSDGFVISSGAGIVVLKRLEDAIADKDHIYCVIKSTSVNNDGNSKVSYSAPSVYGVYNVVQNALDNIELSPEDIGYVEAHGTGTRIGDPIEIEALTKAYQRKTSKKGYCAIGSVKANIGHVDVASGVTGFIKTALCLKHKVIPPQACFEYPNENISLITSPFYINTEDRHWESNGKPRIAAVNSIGMGGTNAHVILSDFCNDSIENKIDCQNFTFPLSAKTESALEVKIDNMIDFIQSTEEELKDIAYTLQVGRIDMKYRCSIICNNKIDVIEKLHEAKKKINLVDNKPVLFEFTQLQPSKDKWERVLKTLPSAKKLMDGYIKCLNRYLNIDAVYGNYDTLDEIDCEMNDFIYGSVIQTVYAKLLKKFGIIPENVISETSEAQFCAMAINQNVSESDFIACLVYEVQQKYRYRKQLDSCILFHYLIDESDVVHIYNHTNNWKFDIDNGNHLIIKLNSCSMESISVDLQSLWLNGQTINWSCYNESFNCYRVSLPSYPFERKRYWIDAITDEDVKDKKDEVKEENTDPKMMDPVMFIRNTWKSLLGNDVIELSDNYFELGGTSLLATHLIATINSHFNSSYTLIDFYSNPTIQGLLDYLIAHSNDSINANETIEEHSSQVIEAIFDKEDYHKADELAKRIGNEIEVEDILPLSSNQERLLFYSLYNRKSNIYYQKYTLDISGEIRVDYIIKSYRKLIESHDVFRSIYTYKKLSQPAQIILKHREPEYCYRDISSVKDVNQWIIDFESHDCQMGFQLSYDNTIRLHLFKIRKNQYKIILSLHHICFDGYSCNVVLIELYNWYCTLIEGKPLEIPDHLSRRTYMEWYLSQSKSDAISYWKEYLDHYKHHSNFVDGIICKKANSNDNIVTKMFTIDGKLQEDMMNYCKRKSITVNTIILFVYALMIAKIEKSRDIVFGVVANGRPETIKGADRLVGIYADVIPLRVNFEQSESIDCLINKIQNDIVLAKKYAYISLMDIIKDTNVIESDFQHVINLNSALSQTESINYLNVTKIELEQKSKYAFCFIIQNTLSGYSVRIEYNENIMDDTVNAVYENIHNLLTSVTKERLSLNELM